jgi:hypothetical protein
MNTEYCGLQVIPCKRCEVPIFILTLVKIVTSKMVHCLQVIWYPHESYLDLFYLLYFNCNVLKCSVAVFMLWVYSAVCWWVINIYLVFSVFTTGLTSILAWIKHVCLMLATLNWIIVAIEQTDFPHSFHSCMIIFDVLNGMFWSKAEKYLPFSMSLFPTIKHVLVSDY